MKIFVFVLILSGMFFFECGSQYGKIRTTKDTYRNSTIISMILRHKSIEKYDSGFEGIKYYSDIKYTRVISSSSELLTIFINLEVERGGLNIENEGYARKRKYRCVKLLIKRIMKDPDYNRIYDDEIR